MEATKFLNIVNSFDNTTKATLKKMLYGDDGSTQNKGVSNISRYSNLLCDDIKNEKVHDLQVELGFYSYSGEGDPMAHFKAFKMKFELNFEVNDNLMDK